MTRLGFDPQLPLALIAALALVAILITAYAFYSRARGAWARGLAFAILLFALAGPVLVKENHAALPDVVAVVMDRSQSMNIGDRAAQAEKALALVFSFTGYKSEQRNFLLNEKEEEQVVIRMERGAKDRKSVV